jgi:hypothetical protein
MNPMFDDHLPGELCRAFGAQITTDSSPDLTVGPINDRPFGPQLQKVCGIRRDAGAHGKNAWIATPGLCVKQS